MSSKDGHHRFTSHPPLTLYGHRFLSPKDFPVTEKDKKKEAKGIEKRTISKITNVGKTPVSGCWIQQKIDWGEREITFAHVLS
ncbi:hypothetical protein ALC53_08468 [Atta colombica]|uniref:Uncharacterized protein n=1 Tax=Atta colombica TaxID=520822 RepID=A0A195BA71_9HYME|nr:hypothetical protein ALC53_08468 [Atta colombica]